MIQINYWKKKEGLIDSGSDSKPKCIPCDKVILERETMKIEEISSPYDDGRKMKLKREVQPCYCAGLYTVGARN